MENVSRQGGSRYRRIKRNRSGDCQEVGGVGRHRCAVNYSADKEGAERTVLRGHSQRWQRGSDPCGRLESGQREAPVSRKRKVG